MNDGTGLGKELEKKYNEVEEGTNLFKIMIEENNEETCGLEKEDKLS